MLISLDAERREGRADICTKKERNGYRDEQTKVSTSKEGVKVKSNRGINRMRNARGCKKRVA
jgi:hypothetical protein